MYHEPRSDEEYVEEEDEDEGDGVGGPDGRGDSSGKGGKIRKKKTRTVFSRSQVIYDHLMYLDLTPWG